MFDPTSLSGSHLVPLDPTSRRDYFTRRKCNLCVARGWLPFVNPDCRGILGCILTLLHTYYPVTSFLVRRPPHWVSYMLHLPHLRALASAEGGPLR